MKLTHCLAVLTTALSSAVAQHEDCSETVIASITEMHEYEHCNRDTGFEFSANGSSELTPELLAQLCATHDCVDLAADIVAMAISECEVNGVHLLMDIVEPITAACASGASTSGSTTAGSVEMEASDDDALGGATSSGAGSATAGSVEMEASDDDVDASADATADSSNSTASTPSPSPTTSGAGVASLTASALFLMSAAALAL